MKIKREVKQIRPSNNAADAISEQEPALPKDQCGDSPSWAEMITKITADVASTTTQ